MAKIKILSIGGYGANILRRLEIDDNQKIAISMDNKIFSKLHIENKIELRRDENINNASNIEDFLKSIIDEKKTEIDNSIKNCDILFLLGNLCNNTSYIQVSEISQMARKQGIITIFIGVTPFSFEGNNKRILSEKNIEYISDNVDGILILDSDKIATQENIKAVDAITSIDKFLIDTSSSIIELLDKVGTINVDFADLRSTIKDSGKIFFNTISGKRGNINDLIEKLIKNTNLKFNKTNFNKVLYVIYGGKGLLTEDINSIGTKLQEYFDEKVQIIFGIVDDDKLKEDIKITLLGA